MKFFIDTADIGEIRDLVAAAGMVDGVTTNPSLVAKSGRLALDEQRDHAGGVPRRVQQLDRLVADRQRLTGNEVAGGGVDQVALGRGGSAPRGPASAPSSSGSASTWS